MVSYNSSDVVQSLRQYDMFANSLRLIKNQDERNMVVKQLTKLEGKIMLLTNDIYLEEYNSLVNKECGLLDEEKERLTALIELINQRLSYVEKRCNNHYALTGESIDAPLVDGADTLDSLENRVRIIDKYKKNIKLKEELENDVKSLSSKISLASEKIDINKSLNAQLETTFKETINNAIEELNLMSLTEKKEDIEYAYYETEKSLRLAESNLEIARTSPANILSDCEQMLDEIKIDYDKYKDQISILKLIDINELVVSDYESLLSKRKEVNEILKYVKNQSLLSRIVDMVTKQYNTILMEQQDVNTFNDLVLERDRKLEAIDEIEQENNSDEFQQVLTALIENERKRQEKILEEQRRIEEIERKKRLEIQRKKQEEILKRQKIIEEARKKEIEKRTKQLLEEQQNSVLQGKKKEKEETVSFGDIKDISTNNDELADNSNQISNIENMSREDYKSRGQNFKLENDKVEIEEANKNVVSNKDDIEKDLFEEFNNRPVNENENLNMDDLFNKLEEKMPENKFPDMSFDEYMNNFNEDKVEEANNFFDDTAFPSIPM